MPSFARSGAQPCDVRVSKPGWEPCFSRAGSLNAPKGTNRFTPDAPQPYRDPTSAIGPKREHAPRSNRFFAFCPLCCTYTQILLLTWWPQPVFQAQRWLPNTTPHLGPGCVELKGKAVPARYPQPGRALAPRRTAICQLGVILAQAINTPSY